jgi:hypothetical protein
VGVTAKHVLKGVISADAQTEDDSIYVRYPSFSDKYRRQAN